MLVHTCHPAEWALRDDTGSPVVSSQSSSGVRPCGGIANYYWDETCIDDTICYNFTVTDTTTPPEQESSPGLLTYLLLYDNDVQVTSVKDVVTSSSRQAGNCPGLA